MNLAKLRARIQHEVTSLSPFKLVEVSEWVYDHLELQGKGLRETQKLEARIADDFDDLPESIAEEFWADALNARLEDDRQEP